MVIGGGIAGMAAAATLAQQGHDITLVDKLESLGGRNRAFTAEGFTFDTGPSWYWMPEIFEQFYARFGFNTSDFYQLKRLDPAYRVYWEDDTFTDIPADIHQLQAVFDDLEPGSGRRLVHFLHEAQKKYELSMSKFVWLPSLTITEYFKWEILKQAFSLDLFKSMSRHVRKFVQHPKLIQLLEFPVLFLGAKHEHTPALYSMMNYADLTLGTWYPCGGMHQISAAFEKILAHTGVKVHRSTTGKQIELKGQLAQGLKTDGARFSADFVVAAGDYHAAEQQLLPPSFRNYNSAYWESRTMAPSALIFFLGFNKKIEGLLHHTLFFDAPFSPHAEDIYDFKCWPRIPLFYVSCTSKTDQTAPAGMENVFVLIPLPAGLDDDAEKHEHYLKLVLRRMEQRLSQSLNPHLVFQRSYAMKNFEEDYFSYKGNAYGLANTLLQTGPLKPSIRNKKISNLFYTGQLTVPGPGLPPAIISGQLVADQIKKIFPIP